MQPAAVHVLMFDVDRQLKTHTSFNQLGSKMSIKDTIYGTIIWCVLCLILLPILILPLIPLAFWRITVLLVAKCCRKHFTPLKPLDLMNVPGSGHEYSVVTFGCVCQIEGEVAVESLRKLFTEKLLQRDEQNVPQYKRLNSSIVMFGGFPFFKMLPELNINEQIYEKKLHDDGEILEDLLAEWIISKFKKDAACWEIIVVPMKDNRTAVAMKIHHGSADGYSLLHILDKLTDNSSPYLVKNHEETFWQNVCQMLAVPSHLMKVMKAPAAGPNPLNFNGIPPSFKYTITFATFDLQVLKKIRRKYNVRIISIILAMMGGAFRRFLMDKNEQGDPQHAAKIPSHIMIGSTLPWPNHPIRNPDSPEICNHWVPCVLKVPLGGDDDDTSPSHRLLSVDQELENFQTFGFHKFANWFMIPLFQLFPSALLRKMSNKEINMTAGYTTALGGDNYKILGKRVVQINGIIQMNDLNPFTIPLSLYSFTHENNFNVTFAGNPTHFPDRDILHNFAQNYMQEEMEKLAGDD